MTCAPFTNLVEWKIWKRSKRVCWTKITSMDNSRNVYQLKDIQPWSESLKRVQVCVIDKSNNCALTDITVVKLLPKTLISMWHRRCAKITLDKNSAVPFHCCDWLGTSSCRDVWSWLLASFRVRYRKYLSFGFIFRISEVLRGHFAGSA